MEQLDVTNSDLMGEEFSEISARREARKRRKIEKLKARGKLTKAQRKAERLKRKLERKAKRAGGIALSAEELIDEQLDIQESRKEGDALETETLKSDAKSGESLNPSTDEDSDDDVSDDKILGMPKMVFYIGLGVVALVGGIIVYKKFIKK